jgi:hypothetical protein
MLQRSLIGIEIRVENQNVGLNSFFITRKDSKNKRHTQPDSHTGRCDVTCKANICWFRRYFGFRPPSSILKQEPNDATVRKLKLFPSLGEGVGELYTVG